MRDLFARGYGVETEALRAFHDLVGLLPLPLLGEAARHSISPDEGVRLVQHAQPPMRRSLMTKGIKSYRYELTHGDDADFVAYQRKSSNGAWQTVSVWLIPQPAFR
jgi:hypothetical protein